MPREHAHSLVQAFVPRHCNTNYVDVESVSIRGAEVGIVCLLEELAQHIIECFKRLVEIFSLKQAPSWNGQLRSIGIR